MHGPARGSEHLVTRYSSDGIRVRGTLTTAARQDALGHLRVGRGKLVSATSRATRATTTGAGRNDKSVVALNRYGRAAGAPSRHGWESAGTDDKFIRWNNGATGASARETTATR